MFWKMCHVRWCVRRNGQSRRQEPSSIESLKNTLCTCEYTCTVESPENMDRRTIFLSFLSVSIHTCVLAVTKKNNVSIYSRGQEIRSPHSVDVELALYSTHFRAVYTIPCCGYQLTLLHKFLAIVSMVSMASMAL